MEFLCFSVKNRRFGIDILKIAEILGPGNHISDQPAFSAERAFIEYKGSEISVIGLRKVLFDTTDSETETARLIICESNGRQMGIIVDTVDEIIRVAKENLSIPGSIPSDIASETVKGAIRQDDEVIYILSPSRLHKCIPA